MTARRARSDPLTRGEIARVALDMVDREGAAAFSMRKLAEQLGVTTMAVYHHFQNKAEVLQAAADQAWIEVVTAIEPVDDPVERIIEGFLTVRRVFRRHAGITPYAVASPTTDDALHVMAVGIAEQFELAGLHGQDAADAYFALATYTLGSAVLHAQRVMLDRSIRQPVSDIGSVVAAEEVAAPRGETYDLVREAMGVDDELVRFERGLRQIMSGFLERR